MNNNITNFLIVGLGGCIGSILRYGLGLSVQNVSINFPYGTFIANLTACLVIGIISELSEKMGIVSPEIRLLLMTGFCGGLSTMSSLIYELSKMIQDREYLISAMYLMLSIIFCLIFYYIGTGMIKLIFRQG